MACMWNFLRQALTLLPAEIIWLVVTPLGLVVVTVCCLFMVSLASGGVVPDTLSAIARYTAGVKMIAAAIAVTVAIPLAMGLAIARIFSGMRDST